jgi:hypothetical protein
MFKVFAVEAKNTCDRKYIVVRCTKVLCSPSLPYPITR